MKLWLSIRLASRRWLALLMIGLLPALAAAANLRVFEPDSLQDIVNQHQGQPFALIVWSLDCSYCRKSLDTLSAERQRDKSLQSLTIVTLATDSAADPQIAALLRERLKTWHLGSKSGEESWAFGQAPPEQLRFAIDPNWRGEMPRSYWFNAEGKPVAHSGLLTPEVLRKLAAQAQR